MLIRLKLQEGWKERLRFLRRDKLLLIASFAAVYIIWGSTYYSIKVAISTLPPFLMAGTRYIIAGIVLFVIALITGAKIPSLKNVKDNAILGFFLLLLGNGGVVWASDKIPSGIIALLITIEPIWIVILVFLRKQGKLPGLQTVLGIILGFAGAAMLLAPGNVSAAGLDPEGLFAIFISTISWAIGSLYAVKANEGTSAFLAAGLQMLLGGLFILIVACFKNEFLTVDPDKFSTESIVAFFYLIVFGSIIGYSAYGYLLKVAHPSQVATYAYVNPLVAVLLGTFLGNEPFTSQIATATILLLAGVILVLSKKAPK